MSPQNSTSLQTHRAFLHLEQRSSVWHKNEAKYQLAVHYESGQTQLEKNKREARKLYMELLKADNWRGKAAYRLSAMSSSDDEKRKWLHEAKKWGSRDAIWELARMTTDLIRKKALLETSSSLNDWRAMMDLAELESDQVGVTMTELDRAEALIEESLLNGASEDEVNASRARLQQKKETTWQAEKQKRSILDHIHHLQTQDPWNRSPSTCQKITQSAMEFLEVCSPYTSNAEFERILRYLPMIHHSDQVSLPFNKKIVERSAEFNLPSQLIAVINSLHSKFGEEAISPLKLHKYFKIALEKAEHEIVEYLLQPFIGLDPVMEAPFAIYWAARHNHFRLIRVLLRDKRLDPSAGNYKAIICASELGHFEIVSDLLRDRRVDPGISHSYALRIASKNGFANIVELLLQHEKVDPVYSADYKDVLGHGALQWAAEEGHVEVVRLLLADKRALAAAEHNYAIRMASKNGHAEICRLLITLRRSVDVATHNQFPLREAVKGAHHEVVRVLLEEAAGKVDPSFNNWEVHKVCAERADMDLLKLLMEFRIPEEAVLEELIELLTNQAQMDNVEEGHESQTDDDDTSDSRLEETHDEKHRVRKVLRFVKTFVE